MVKFTAHDRVDYDKVFDVLQELVAEALPVIRARLSRYVLINSSGHCIQRCDLEG